MSPDASVIDQAYQAFREGDIARAVVLGRSVLEAEPKNGAALHLVGLIALQGNQHEEAIDLLKRAVSTEPRSAQLQQNLGAAYDTVGQYQQAVDCYQRALALDPNSVQTCMKLGNSLRALGRHEEALRAFQDATVIDANSGVAQFNLAVALQSVKRVDEAISAYRRVIELAPGFSQAHYNLGTIYHLNRDWPAAVEQFAAAVAASPTFAQARYGLAVALTNLNRIGEAVGEFRRVLELQPHDPLSLFHLAAALVGDRRFAEAEPYHREAAELSPDNALVHFTMAFCVQMQGRFQEACEWYQRALAINPNEGQFHYFYGMARLAEADFTAWPEFLWRIKTSKHSDRHSYGGREWNGEPLSNEPILIYCDGGMGDSIHFLRYVPRVIEHGGRVTLALQQGLIPLLTESGYTNCIPLEKGVSSPDAWQVSIINLPAAFGTELATIPGHGPYIKPRADRVEHWREKLSTLPGLRVGINWEGSTNAPFERRSIPLELFEPLSRIDGVALISLQRYQGLDELDRLSKRFPLVELGRFDAEGAFLDTAAIMKNLDLVITCDTSVAHLAGALAVPVWTGLSKYCDWRWMRHREDTPWYPTMRLFRQTTLDDWTDVMARIASELRLLASSFERRGT